MKMASKVVVLGVSAALLAACGQEQADAPPPAQTDAATETAAVTPEPAATEAAPPPAADSTDTMDGMQLASFTADPAHGKTVFIKCQSCHSLEPGQNRIGPSLAGLVGREAGSVEGYNYSPANANSGITWTPEKLFQYLENPQRVIPGTKMAFPGLPEAQDRADVIAYIQSGGA